MLFYKSLVSFVGAIALASTVTASATPVRRTTMPGADCSVSDQKCCDSTTTFGSLGIVDQVLVGLLPGINTGLLVGAGCTLTGTLLCGTQQSSCCTGSQSQVGSLINVGFNCVNIVG